MRLLLAGGGHSHVEVLRRFARAAPRAASLTLVSPDAAASYSGMLPGLVAGHYRREETEIPLAPLARAAGAAFLRDRIVALDLAERAATLASGRTLAFDVVSLDVGSIPDAALPGAREHALSVKPVPAFLDGWAALRRGARAGLTRAIAVVGGGAGGAEIVLAMHHRLHREFGPAAPGCALVTDQPVLLPQHAPGVRRRVAATLSRRGIAVHVASRVRALAPGHVVIDDGRRIAADAVVLATTATAARWLAASGLDVDDRGFVCVDAQLRSRSHPFVFAGGDCATLARNAHPKSGLYAVRHGPVLAANLLACVHGGPLRRFRPQAHALALIATGGREAILSWGPLSAHGAWVWRWKDRIDRRFVARYTAPADPAAAVDPPSAD